MGIFKTKVWAPLDIGLLKWSCILFGMIVGAYISSFVKDFLWLFILLTIVLAIRPIYCYWFKK